jgi:hypothetical protein
MHISLTYSLWTTRAKSRINWREGSKHKNDDARDPIIAWVTPPRYQNTRSNPRTSAETYLDFPPLACAAPSSHFPMRAPCYVKHVEKTSAASLGMPSCWPRFVYVSIASEHSLRMSSRKYAFETPQQKAEEKNIGGWILEEYRSEVPL